MTAKKANKSKAPAKKSGKQKTWKFTAELPTIGLVKMGSTATDEEVKALISAGLRECTYLIEL